MEEIRAKERAADSEAGAYNFILEAIKSRSNITEIIRDDKKSEVFKVTSHGQIFVVKRLKGNFAKKLVDFDNEVGCMGGVLGHTNIVKLYDSSCDDKEECILVYDWPSSSSVTTLEDGIKEGISCELGLKFASDIAYAILYIHEAVPPIIHGDLRPSSIFYDDSHVPKICDFGTKEPALGEPLTTKTDVYYFGVMLLEIITGKMAEDKSRGKNKLIEDWLSNKIKNTEDLSTIVDPRMVGQLSEAMIHKALKISLACVKRSATDRPDMKEVVLAMNCLCPKPESLAEWPEIFDRVQFSSLLRRVPEKYSAKKFHVFSRAEVYEMTHNFSGPIEDRDCVIGTVYKGKQPGTNLRFEMKRQLPLSHTASEEFHNEVKILTGIRQLPLSHPNIVEIIGKHDFNDEHIIVQPHMQESLGKWLDDGGFSLQWDLRMEMAVGVAKGLCYLHSIPVAHNNIRSTNILIDAGGQPRISDFGRAKPIKDAKDEFKDKYNFGLLLVELISGKKSHTAEGFDLETIANRVKADDYTNMVDSRLDGKFPDDVMKALVSKVAVKCYRDDVDMPEVLRSLLYLTSTPYAMKVARSKKLLLLAEEDEPLVG